MGNYYEFSLEIWRMDLHLMKEKTSSVGTMIAWHQRCNLQMSRINDIQSRKIFACSCLTISNGSEIIQLHNV